MRTGPKGKSPEQKQVSGFHRPSRAAVSLFPDHASQAADVVPAPEGITAAAREIWDIKVARYRRRGQKIEGFEDGLRQYCELEAELNKGWSKGAVTMAMVNAHRIWSAEFFDTPASQRVRATDQKSNNRFVNNGQRQAR